MTNAPIDAELAEAGIGHNKPPADMLLRADDLLDTFQREPGGKYVGMAGEVADLLLAIRGEKAGVSGVPATIETDADDAIVAAFMEQLRKLIKRVDASRENEKAPYLAAERGVQNYFGGFLARLEKTQTILQARGNDYTRRKAAQARQEREAAAAAERARLAEIARLEAEQRQAAAEAAAAAERARKPENIAAHEERAQQATVAAAVLQVDQMVQADRAREAEIATKAKTADLVRTRHASGHMSTAKQEPHVEIVDIDKIDLNFLRPYIKQDAVLSALKAYGKIIKHKVPDAHADKLAGAVIEMRDAADYR